MSNARIISPLFLFWLYSHIYLPYVRDELHGEIRSYRDEKNEQSLTESLYKYGVDHDLFFELAHDHKTKGKELTLEEFSDIFNPGLNSDASNQLKFDTPHQQTQKESSGCLMTVLFVAVLGLSAEYIIAPVIKHIMHETGLYGINTSDFSRGYGQAEYYGYTSPKKCEGDSEEFRQGCVAYIKNTTQKQKLYVNSKTFHGFDCTDDCSGHEAGYEWAEENDIDDVYDCDNHSQSFEEGCVAYVEEYAP